MPKIIKIILKNDQFDRVIKNLPDPETVTSISKLIRADKITITKGH